MTKVVIIDSGGYNIGSVFASLQRLEIQAQLTSDHETIKNADYVILPGVGAAAHAMHKLHKNELVELIPTLTQPVLGICLGMQLMFEYSEEGNTECLGIFSGHISKMKGANNLRIPHMGWNTLSWERRTPIAGLLPDPAWMYFVHAYAAPITSETLASSEHGQRFATLAQKNNFLAAQFHPERSAAAGVALLKHFFSL